MQDQGKRLVLTVALALGVILAWNYLFPKDEPPKPPQGSAQGSATGSGSVSTATPGSLALLTPVGPTAVAGEPARPSSGTEVQLPFPHFIATFSDSCGGLVSWKLTDPRYVHDGTRGELLPPHAHFTAEGK